MERIEESVFRNQLSNLFNLILNRSKKSYDSTIKLRRNEYNLLKFKQIRLTSVRKTVTIMLDKQNFFKYG